MGRLKRRWVEICLVGTLPVAASAQNPIPLNETPKEETAKIEVGGTPALDIITLKAIGPGAPLRYGNVVSGSERVSLDGRPLEAVKDYGMDYATGVVYMKVAQKAGQVLTVSYRYDSKAPAPSTPVGGVPGLRYNLLPGNLSMVMGLGMTERAADGSVLSTNVFGWNNTFKLGQGGKLSGMFVVGESQKNDVEGGFNLNPNAKPGDSKGEEGKSKLIVQNFRSALMGGKVSVDYEESSKNFSAFNTLRESGYDEATINRLSAERGMKRFGFAVDDLKVGGLGFSNSYRTIEDEKGSIDWRSFGFNGNGLKVNWNSQRVDQNFTRFKDIGEADKQQLMKEKGMSRENMSAEFAQKVGKFSYTTSSIQDDVSGKGISKKVFALDTSRIDFELGEQEVDTGFNRFASLLGPEQAMYGREAGLSRQWMKLQSTLFGSSVPLAFNQSTISSANGKFSAQDVSVKGSTWSLERTSRSVDSGFTSLNAMQEPEIQGHLNAIANMYGPDAKVKPEDKNRFFGNQGLSRDFTRVGFQPFKDWKIDFSQLNLKGQQDSGRVESLQVQGKNFSANYRKQDLGKNFTEISSLMDFERQRLGTVAGLERTDFGLNMSLGKGSTFALNQLTASTEKGTAQRTSLDLKSKNLDVTLAAREVDPGMDAVAHLVDPERQMLNSLRGFSEKDAKVRWQILPNLKLDAFLMEATNPYSEETRMAKNLLLNWAPNKGTQFEYARFEQRSDDPVSKLFANVVERMSVNKDLGRLGYVKYLNERQEFDGTTTTNPSWQRQFLAYETKLNDKTRVRTEQQTTKYDTGDREHISSNTLSTELSKRTGVSVSDVKIDRTGDERDEVKRNYGFWFDLGNGLRVSYGYARHLNGESASTLASSLAVGQNAGQIAPNQTGSVQAANVGGVMIGGGYGVNQWEKDDQIRTQAFSNVSISSARPFRIGALQDVKFSFGLDTAADYSKWLKENKLFQFSGRIGSNQLGYEYKSQMHTSGLRGIDRTFKFETDQSDKRWLRASIFYKLRTLPWDDQVMIRNFNITAKPAKNLEITNQVQTNPEVVKADALLGSIPQAARSNKWRLDYKQSGNLTLGMSWEELINEQADAIKRTGGVNIKLFEKSGSPLTLFYGLEQLDHSSRRTTHRYHLQFDQRPGPNQTFSLFLGNVSYEHSIADQMRRNNWTLRLDYQFRF